MSDLSRLKPSWTQKSSHISSQNLFYFKSLIAGKIMHPAVRLYIQVFSRYYFDLIGPSIYSKFDLANFCMLIFIVHCCFLVYQEECILPKWFVVKLGNYLHESFANFFYTKNAINKSN